MPFSKSFPRTLKGTTYPIWEEVMLSEDEERDEERKCRKENIWLMKECLEDAKAIMKEKDMKDFQTDTVHIALALFEKRASHVVYWKENKAKEKFDRKFMV